MAVNSEDIKLGVCDVTFDGLDLGSTKGGVEVSFETTTYEVKVDQTGETPAKETITGTTVTVKVPMAETNLERMLKVIPQARAVLTGSDVTGLRIGTGVNVDMFAVAKELILHPTGVSLSDRSDDFGLFKAAPTASFSYTYMTNQERVYEITFKGYPHAQFDNDLCWFGAKPSLHTVYAGRGASANLDATATQALTSSTYAGRSRSIAFAANSGGVGTGYLWLSWPASLDTGFTASTSVLDAGTGFVVPFQAGATVTINSVSYVTYRSQNAINGAITVQVG
jgi:hypothetical protein